MGEVIQFQKYQSDEDRLSTGQRLYARFKCRHHRMTPAEERLLLLAVRSSRLALFEER